MKYKCFPSQASPGAKGRFEWHKWFAWKPVYVSNGWYVWLEWIERKDCGLYSTKWDYRFVIQE